MADLPVHPELGDDFDYRRALADVEAALLGGHPTPNAQAIAQAGVQLVALLLRKNAAYGDSALAPLAVFARDLTPSQRMGVRMDDKLSRLARGHAAGEDVEMDLAGYLLLKRIADAQEVPRG